MTIFCSAFDEKWIERGGGVPFGSCYLEPSLSSSDSVKVMVIIHRFNEADQAVIYVAAINRITGRKGKYLDMFTLAYYKR